MMKIRLGDLNFKWMEGRLSEVRAELLQFRTQCMGLSLRQVIQYLPKFRAMIHFLGVG